jgi:dynein light chain 4
MADVGSTANLAVAEKPGAQAPAATENQEQKKTFNYALVKVSSLNLISQYCDMVDELRVESVDMCVTAVEKHPGNYEVKN